MAVELKKKQAGEQNGCQPLCLHLQDSHWFPFLVAGPDVLVFLVADLVSQPPLTTVAESLSLPSAGKKSLAWAIRGCVWRCLSTDLSKMREGHLAGHCSIVGKAGPSTF